ncbi:MAG: indole-3-glycerol phosphate synthase TrpC [Acidobacteriota bacterium]
MTTRAPADLLETIVAATRRTLQVRREREPMRRLEALASQRCPRRDLFRLALARPTQRNVIAECKRRSPVRGVLRAQYDPVSIAAAFERAGAAAVSVLTEPSFFDGSLEHLRAVRDSVSLPLLRKDFVLDEYQLLEARAAGADAVLLIVAALSDADLVRLLEAAAGLELAVLVEVHDVGELDRALGAGASIVGVNNRNLRTLAVDLHASIALAARLPAHVVAVSESGLGSSHDVSRLRALGYRAFLVGERLMMSPDPGAALRALLEPAPGGGAAEGSP